MCVCVCVCVCECWTAQTCLSTPRTTTRGPFQQPQPLRSTSGLSPRLLLTRLQTLEFPRDEFAFCVQALLEKNTAIHLLNSRHPGGHQEKPRTEASANKGICRCREAICSALCHHQTAIYVMSLGLLQRERETITSLHHKCAREEILSCP